MNLSTPWEGVLEPGLGRVITRLAILPGPATGRRIHELSGNATLNVTQRVLRNLTDIGLVKLGHVATANLYTLNRKHLLWEKIEHILALPTEYQEELGRLFTRLAPTSTLTLYGSTARRESQADSDVDLVILWDPTVDQDTRLDILDQLESFTADTVGNVTEIFELELPQLVDMYNSGDPLVSSWLRDGIHLGGPAPIRTQFQGARR